MQQYYYKNWRDLIKPKALDVDKDSLTPTYGKFVAKPLERGYGITLGNSLRRVLLSSLQGVAVVNVKIDGVQHEYSTIEGVREDVIDIILNIKEVRFKVYSDKLKVLKIEKIGPGEVTAADIQVDDQVEVLTPEKHICTLSEGSKFKAYLSVKMGHGYVSSDVTKVYDESVGTIPLDAIFSPVKKVNYSVSQARVGQRTDFDKLTVEVWTDGSVTPEDALAYGSKILKDQLTVFLNFEEEQEPLDLPKEEQESSNENLYKSVDELELSVRSANCLQNANIKYIYELVGRSESEMLRTKNFGRKSLNEIKEILTGMGLSLGMDLKDFELPVGKLEDKKVVQEKNEEIEIEEE